MEFRLELMTVVSSNFPNAERERLNDMINEADRVRLGVLIVDL